MRPRTATEMGYVPDQAMNREVNRGAPEFRGRVELGSEQRKTYAGCAKLNDAQYGVFGISQGIGDEHVAMLVAKDLVRSASQELGASLDQQIQNNYRSPGTLLEKMARIDALIQAKLKEIFLPTIAKMRSRSVLQNEFHHAGLRASVVKLVDVADGSKRLYLSHLGDARVYVLRGDVLTQMSEDDTGLVQQVQAGFLTPEQYQTIDQTKAPHVLSHHEQQLFPLRNDVVSVTEKNVTRIIPKVEVFEVLPGDRLVIVNAGVQHNLTTREIRNWLTTVSDDLQAEDVLQRAADDEAGKKIVRPGRAQAEDLAAVVHTI